jgi:hypothetical protein
MKKALKFRAFKVWSHLGSNQGPPDYEEDYKQLYHIGVEWFALGLQNLNRIISADFRTLL